MPESATNRKPSATAASTATLKMPYLSRNMNAKYHIRVKSGAGTVTVSDMGDGATTLSEAMTAAGVLVIENLGGREYLIMAKQSDV